MCDIKLGMCESLSKRDFVNLLNCVSISSVSYLYPFNESTVVRE